MSKYAKSDKELMVAYIKQRIRMGVLLPSSTLNTNPISKAYRLLH